MLKGWKAAAVLAAAMLTYTAVEQMGLPILWAIYGGLAVNVAVNFPALMRMKLPERFIAYNRVG